LVDFTDIRLSGLLYRKSPASSSQRTVNQKRPHCHKENIYGATCLYTL